MFLALQACPECIQPSTRCCPVSDCKHPITVDWFTYMQVQ